MTKQHVMNREAVAFFTGLAVGLLIDTPWYVLMPGMAVAVIGGSLLADHFWPYSEKSQ